jgi:hypothetical protein
VVSEKKPKKFKMERFTLDPKYIEIYEVDEEVGAGLVIRVRQDDIFNQLSKAKTRKLFKILNKYWEFP